MGYGLIPAMFLPDTLYINVGVGGDGGLPNSNGSGGTASYVTVRPDFSTSTNIVMYGIGGGPGLSTGNAGSVANPNITTSNLGKLGIYVSPAGFGGSQVGGSSGGANTGGNGGTIGTFHISSGGAGGGGSSSTNTNGSGGPIGNLNQTTYPNISGGVGGGTNNGIDGIEMFLNNSFNKRDMIQSTGGSGGGANGLGIGGNGGNGGLSSGGGGGGAGLTGGSGGRGGNGFVLIICF
jgi:hypothetical protein